MTDGTQQSGQQQGGFDLGAAAAVAQAEDAGQWIDIFDEAGRPLTFRTPEGQTEPVRMLVAGSYSAHYRREAEAQRARSIRRGSAVDAAKRIAQRERELVSACVLDWRGFFRNGKPMPLTRESVQNVLEQAPWIHDQVQLAMEDHAGFSRAG